MSVYVKQISELPIVEEINGSENIIVNDNGETKKLPINKVSPQNIKKEQLSEELLNYLATKEDAWPADLPKPSVGGYGYTESGVETILVDNEKVTTVSYEGGSTLGKFVTPFDIVDGAYTVIINGTEYNLNSTFDEGLGFWYIGDISESGADFSRYPFVIAIQGEDANLVTESAGDYDVTIKTTPNTIHKIDEKYLPASGVDYDEISGGNITEVNGKKYFTPLGAGYVPHKVYGMTITTEAQMDGETTWGDSLCDAILVPGETYEISINGVTNTYICQIEDDCYYIGAPHSKMDSNPSVGDWQFVSYDGEYNLYCNVCGYEGDNFEFEFTGMLVERSLISSNWLELPDFPDFSSKMNANNPVGTGSFSMNRSAGFTIGEYSFAAGEKCKATGKCSIALGSSASAEAEGAFAQSYGTARGFCSHAEGMNTIASGSSSHAEGNDCRASGSDSHAEGLGTRANCDCQHVGGKYNKGDDSLYAHIIGNGTYYDRHNCFMVGWDGAIYVQASDDASKMMKITVTSDGTITATQATV